MSVDGIGETHDAIRNKKGAFYNTIKGIENAKEQGISVGVNATISYIQKIIM